jgi:hypothetical protein
MDLSRMMLKFFWLTIIPRLAGRLVLGALLIGFSKDLNNETNSNVAFYLGMVMIVWVIFSGYRTSKVYAQLKNNLTEQ